MNNLVQTITTDQFAGQAGVYHYDPATGTRSRAGIAPAMAPSPGNTGSSTSAALETSGQQAAVPATSALPAPAALAASDNGENAK